MRSAQDVGFIWEGRVKPEPPKVPDTGWQRPDDYWPDLSAAKWIAVDCETYDPELTSLGPGVRRPGCFICGVAINSDISRAAYYPVSHTVGDNMPKRKVFRYLNEQLSRPNQPKVGANILYDVDWLTSDGVRVAPPYYDCISTEGLLTESRLSYKLDVLAKYYLDGVGKFEQQMVDWINEAYPRENPKGCIYKTPPELVGPYAEGDVILPPLILQKQMEIIRERQLTGVFKMEFDLLPALLHMRQLGVPVDIKRAEIISGQMDTAFHDKVAEIQRLTGIAIEVWSSDSLAKLFDHLGVKYPFTTGANPKPSFTKGYLKSLKGNDVIELLRDARTLHKLRSTFVDSYVRDYSTNGRIHCEFHHLKRDSGGTGTGRLSSSNPNLQNIPTRDPVYGPLIRSLFIPEAGMRWWTGDFSQIEYRLIVENAFLQMYDGAAEVIELYRNDPTTDFHKALGEMTGLGRPDAKTLNFGLAYGQGLETLCHGLNVDATTGKAIISTYHERAPFIRKLMNYYSDMASTSGFIRTLSGRQRVFDTWETRDGKYTNDETLGVRRAHLHKALNSAIQGSAADVMKRSMVNAWDAGIFDVLPIYLTVHDELDGATDGSPAHEEARAELKNIMENAYTTQVPMVVEVGEGANWAEAKGKD